jgi:hypothetical protein
MLLVFCILQDEEHLCSLVNYPIVYNIQYSSHLRDSQTL